MAPTGVILSDCCNDANAAARLAFRWLALFGNAPSTPPGVNGPMDAGATLLHMLVAGTTALGQVAYPGIIVVNSAIRGNKQDGPNGTPFCWFWHEGNLVVSTLDDQTLSPVRRHLHITSVSLTDISRVLEASGGWCDSKLTNNEAEMICGTQFRSLWYQLLLARWVWDRQPVPCAEYALTELPRKSKVVVVDAFGNCQTDQLWREVATDGSHVRVVVSGRQPFNLACYRHLADVPVGVAALVEGSSGSGFADIVVQKASVAKELHLGIGSELHITPQPAVVV